MSQSPSRVARVAYTKAGTGGEGTTLPNQTGHNNQYLQTTGTALQWNSPSGSGDVVGPASSTTDDIATYSSTTGKAVKDGGKKIADLVLTGDSRLSDARTPLTHAHAPGDVTGTAVVTADSRLSDARTPTAHSHTPSDVTGTAVVTADARLSDARTPTTHDNTKHTVAYQVASEKAAANGIASLDANSLLVQAAKVILSTASALTSTEGYIQWQSTLKALQVYDTQRARSMSDRGWIPYAYPINFAPAAAFTTALALAAAGGSIAIPIWVDGQMLLQSVSVRNTDAATARTWGWNLYEQYLNNGNAGENSLASVAACAANETFTPGAASTRTVDAGSAPVYLGPGCYWLVVQSRHATSTFGLGSTASSAAFAGNTAQTKTTSNPNGATLDLVAATWTKVTATYAVRLNGRVFGQTVAF